MATALPLPIPQGWLLTPAAADYMGVSVRYLNKLHQEKGQLHPRNFAGRLLWEIAELDAYVAAHPRVGSKRREQQAAA